jgi:hypothetical protein
MKWNPELGDCSCEKQLPIVCPPSKLFFYGRSRTCRIGQALQVAQLFTLGHAWAWVCGEGLRQALDDGGTSGDVGDIVEFARIVEVIEQGLCLVRFEIAIAAIAHGMIMLARRGHDGSIEIRLRLDNREKIMAIVVFVLRKTGKSEQGGIDIQQTDRGLAKRVKVHISYSPW